MSFCDEERATAKRSQWVTADDGNDTEPAWALNKRAETTVQWLSDAAETVADIAMDSEEQTLRTLFPSRREIKRHEECEGARKRAAAARKRKPTEGPGTAGPGQSIH